MKKARFGILKNDGTLVIPIEYSAIENYNSNGDPNPKFYSLKKDGRYALLNLDLLKIAESDENYFNLTVVNGTEYISFKNGKNRYGLVDQKGNIKVPFIYNETLYFDRNPFSIAKKDNRQGIIGINNRVIIPFDYGEIVQIDDEETDLFIASKKGGDAVMNLDHKTILTGEKIHSIYNHPLKFIVKRKGKYGIVDLQNKIILPFEYDEISNWTEYGPRVSKFIIKDGKTGLIDENTFKITIPPVYDEFKYVNGLIFAKRNKKAGIIDESGKVLCPFVFDQIYPSLLDVYDPRSNELRIFARKGRDYYQVDHSGKILKSNITLPEVLKQTVLPELPPPPKPN